MNLTQRSKRRQADIAKEPHADRLAALWPYRRGGDISARAARKHLTRT
jgi:hypothetical protein